MDVNDLYQELIIDHGTDPRNHGEIAIHNHDAEGFNPLCGDKIHVYVLLENDIIKDVSFISKGCAISTASASIMSEVIKGKTLLAAQELFTQFIKMLTTEQQPTGDMGKLMALANVRRYPSRVKCATLAWHTLQNCLGSDHDKHE